MLIAGGAIIRMTTGPGGFLHRPPRWHKGLLMGRLPAAGFQQHRHASDPPRRFNNASNMP